MCSVPLSPLNDTLIFSARTAGFQRTINIFFIPTAKQENKNISQRRHSWGSKRKSLEIQRNVMVNNKKNRLYQDLTGHLRNVTFVCKFGVTQKESLVNYQGLFPSYCCLWHKTNDTSCDNYYLHPSAVCILFSNAISEAIDYNITFSFLWSTNIIAPEFWSTAILLIINPYLGSASGNPSL